MENIKFRFWDNFNGEYYYSDKHEKLSSFFRLYEKALEAENNPVLEQFTGLQDKNKKNIYEGDIIQINDFISSTGVRNAWVSEKKQVIRNIKFGRELSYLYFIPHCSIIGNIHENPELLTKNK